MIQFSQLKQITGGKEIAFYRDASLSTLITDSRKAAATPGAIFFAIKGDRHNGHDYLLDLYNQGIRQFVVEDTPKASLPQSNIILVESAVDALQKIATAHRTQFNLPVIGITGSNGKTILKEWLYQMISPHAVVVKNPGSYNSQIGVPLSVWQIRDEHKLAIFEAGISRPGEMEKLASIIKPTLGVFTNLGSAHDEGFSSLQEKGLEKMKLFQGADNVIYCADHSTVKELISAAAIKSTGWGFSGDADIQIQQLNNNEYSISNKDINFKLHIPFHDAASKENLLHAVAVMIVLGYDANAIQSGINTLRSVPMRLELKEGINQCQVIDDTYNNDLAGLEMSLQFLSHQYRKKKKTLILSDILESGLNDSVLLARVEELLNKYGVNRFIGVGKVLSSNKDRFREGSSFFETTEEFLRDFDTRTFQDEIILVKGARVFGFERVIRKLQKKVHGTVMEIDLGAIVHNFNFIKSRLDRKTKVMVMVKAFAYGSGSNEIANLLQYHQADYLGVAYADEGVELRKNNITLPIMVMNPSPDSFESLLHAQLEPEIYSFGILESFTRFLNGRPAKIHIKIDTGMHRLGFERKDLTALTAFLSANRSLTVASIFSHLVGADEEKHDAFSKHQAELFIECATAISDALGYKPIHHILNSPGILRLPQYQFDMVRLGIGLYGVDPTGNESADFRPAATLKTVISQIKQIGVGESIGYGRRGLAESPMTLATIAIGYADGFSRAFSRGVGKVFVHGKKVPVVGNVCMDMCMIDVTGLSVSEGDEVIIFGKELPISEVAESIATIPYEILTSTSERVKRIFVAESI